MPKPSENSIVHTVICIHLCHFQPIECAPVLTVGFRRKGAQSRYSSPGSPTSPTFVLFNTITTKSKVYTNHAIIMKPQKAEDLT